SATPQTPGSPGSAPRAREPALRPTPAFASALPRADRFAREHTFRPNSPEWCREWREYVQQGAARQGKDCYSCVTRRPDEAYARATPSPGSLLDAWTCRFVTCIGGGLAPFRVSAALRCRTALISCIATRQRSSV